MEHITLTLNILWQVWKARNNRIFNASPRHPIRITQKAQNEWLEYKEAIIKGKMMSMPETIELKAN